MKYGRIARLIRRYLPFCEEKGYSLESESSLDELNRDIQKLVEDANDSVYLCLSEHFPLQSKTLETLQPRKKDGRDRKIICSHAYSANLESFSLDHLATAQTFTDFIVVDRTALFIFTDGKALFRRNNRIQGERLGDRFNNLYRRLESQDRFSE